MEITVQIIVSGLSGIGVLGLVVDRVWRIAKEKKNGNADENILKAIGDLGDQSDEIQQEIGQTQSDINVVKNELANINKRCVTHMENQAQINKSHSISISKNIDKLFELAKKE